ncbi:undecaprenyl-diphosphate phosphatase [Pelagibacterales bacterium SAG-MED23]|nr:undecaprenyl-diphosphate phosphatase [Pelagibacterales bacterium SAG-MED23]
MISKYIEATILAFVQGFSEFIPVSSSAQLIIISKLSNFSISSLQLDISLHLGSLLAIVFYFRRDLLDLLNNKSLLLLIILGSLPLVIFGFIVYSTGLVDHLRNLKVIAWTTLLFGILLFLADRMTVKNNIENNLNIKNILIIGIFQILAIIPGVSRSGIIITISRFLKFDRVDSSKISFYLSIPALAGASVLSMKDIINKDIDLNFVFIYSIIFSFLISYFTIKYFLIYVKNFNLNIFVYYRTFLALILFAIAYT